MASQRKRTFVPKSLSKLFEMVTLMLLDDDEENNEKVAPNGNSARLTTSVTTTVSKQSACSLTTCRKPFSLLETSRICSMCKKEFCRTCAAYRRRLSGDGDPDPLGQLHHVCRSCLEAADSGNHSTNHTRQYRNYRRTYRERAKKANGTSEAPTPVGATTDKDDAKQMADRLAKGFDVASRSGWMAGLVSEVVVPDWQKASPWHRAADHAACEGCSTSFGFLSRKVNCRTCGRVFCSDCTKQEILLYTKEGGGAAWAINGKEGVPATKPRRLETLPICNACCSELQLALVARLFPVEDLQRDQTSRDTEFIDDLVGLQKKLISLENAIEGSLPEYMYLVEYVDNSSAAPSTQPPGHTERPTYTLSKLQYELIQHFSQLAVSSQKLKSLQPCTQTQAKLLQNVISGIFHYYTENVFLFRSHKQRLSQHMSESSLVEMRVYINERSLTNVCALLIQLTSEGEGVAKEEHFSSLVVTMLGNARDISLQELKLSFEKQGSKDWEKHYETLLSMGMDDSIKRLNMAAKDTPLLPALRSYALILKVLPLLRSCWKCLSNTTASLDFPKTKSAVLEITNMFQMIHTHFLFLGLSYNGQRELNGSQYKPLVSIIPLCVKVCEKELKPLMVPYSCWEKYSTEIEALRKWWWANPKADPMDDSHALNPYFAPLRFISNELGKLTECAEDLGSRGRRVECPQTMTILKDMSEVMRTLKGELVLCYALFGLSELTYEYALVQREYDIDSSVVLPVVEVTKVCDEELKALVSSSQWGEYSKEMKQYLNTCICYHRRIKLDGMLLPNDKPRLVKMHCKYALASTMLAVASDIYSYLEIHTVPQEFSKVKSSLKAACATIEGMKASLKHELHC